MNAKDIQRYLSLVGKELQAMEVEEPIRLLLIGGGYMLTQVRNRTVTGDIDMVWMYPEIYADSEIYRLFEAAIQFVTDDEHLGPSWFSTDASDFVFAAGPLPKRKLWKKFGLVQVYLPPKDFISLSLRERRIQQIFRLSVRNSALTHARKHKKYWISISA